MDNDALYETDDNKKKFQLTRGMLILAAVILVVIIIVIIIIVHSVKSKEPEYTTNDFKHLEKLKKFLKWSGDIKLEKTRCRLNFRSNKKSKCI